MQSVHHCCWHKSPIIACPVSPNALEAIPDFIIHKQAACLPPPLSAVVKQSFLPPSSLGCELIESGLVDFGINGTFSITPDKQARYGRRCRVRGPVPALLGERPWLLCGPRAPRRNQLSAPACLLLSWGPGGHPARPGGHPAPTAASQG